jgi:hypothetical protein
VDPGTGASRQGRDSSRDSRRTALINLPPLPHAVVASLGSSRCMSVSVNYVLLFRVWRVIFGQLCAFVSSCGSIDTPGFDLPRPLTDLSWFGMGLICLAPGHDGTRGR